MPEMILPGTYIEVRSEGLISAGPISTGNVGIVGTSSRGHPGKIEMPANLAHARSLFGGDEEGEALTLVRSLALLFANGARSVRAVRIEPRGGTKAEVAIDTTDGKLVLEAIAPGSGYNGATVTVKTDGPGTVKIDGEGTVKTDGAGTKAITIRVDGYVERFRRCPPAAETVAKVIKGEYDKAYYRRFASGRGSDIFTVKGPVPRGDIKDKEEEEEEEEGYKVKPLGNNGNPRRDDFVKALDALTDADAQIVLIAGRHKFVKELIAHVQNASDDRAGEERIAIYGETWPDVNAIDPRDQTEGRLVCVTPGIKIPDQDGVPQTLDAAYAAAAIAGKLASIPPHVSLTNKTITCDEPETRYTPSQLEAALLSRTCVLRYQDGAVKVVKGITTSTDTAYAQITTRRIVDYAKKGVRRTANQFIGRLNIARVREALRGALNGFLAGMINREMITDYVLEVSATRDQEIRGIVQVAMLLKPTFSIDYVRVVMTLQ